jgi:hypothetical protein
MSKHGHGGRRNEAANANGHRVGRPPKPILERAPQRGRVGVFILEASALQLQQLMLRETPGVGTPEQMVEWLIARAIEELRA